MTRHFLVCALACVSTASLAQDVGATFRNFRHPPPGQYTQTLAGVVNGQPGPPRTRTVCSAGTPDRQAIAAAGRMAAASGCETRVLSDTERLAVSEQTCHVGNRQQITRTTVRGVDDRTFTVDTVMRIAGLPDTTTHSTVVYQGPCTAASSTANQPSAEECAELRASLTESPEAGAVCAQVPADRRAACQARVAAGRQMAEVAAARCR